MTANVSSSSYATSNSSRQVPQQVDKLAKKVNNVKEKLNKLSPEYGEVLFQSLQNGDRNVLVFSSQSSGNLGPRRATMKGVKSQASHGAYINKFDKLVNEILPQSLKNEAISLGNHYDVIHMEYKMSQEPPHTLPKMMMGAAF